MWMGACSVQCVIFEERRMRCSSWGELFGYVKLCWIVVEWGGCRLCILTWLFGEVGGSVGCWLLVVWSGSLFSVIRVVVGFRVALVVCVCLDRAQYVR